MLIIPFFPVFARRPGFDSPPILPYYSSHTQIDSKLDRRKIMQNTRSREIISTLLLLLTAMIWGAAFVAQSVGADNVGAFTFLASRSWLAGVALLPLVAVMRRKTDRPSAGSGDRRTLVTGGLLCGFFLFIASAAQQIGIATTTTAKAGFLTALYVIIVPILSIVVRKRVPVRVWISALIAVTGLYLLCMKGRFSLEAGDAMELLCAFLFACHIMIIDRFSPKTDGVAMSCIQFFACALFSTVCALLFEHPHWAQIRAALLPILYAGIFSSGVGYTLQIISQKNLHPTVASITMSLESVFSAVFGWILLHQALNGREILGCLLMFSAIILAQLPSPGQNDRN